MNDLDPQKPCKHVQVVGSLCALTLLEVLIFIVGVRAFVLCECRPHGDVSLSLQVPIKVGLCQLLQQDFHVVLYWKPRCHGLQVEPLPGIVETASMVED